MHRRCLIQSLPFASALSAATFAAAAPAPYTYKLRYAPRLGLVNLPIPRQMEIYAEWGFKAFEYNGLPTHPLSEIEAFRKKREELGLAMGVFVVNRGGWKPISLPDKSGHGRFLEDVKKAVTIHNIMGNEAATVTSGLGVEHLSFEQQTRNCIEGLKRAAEIVEKTKMVLVLEPLNQKVDHAGYFVTYSEHAAEIIGGVNHPQVKILFDMYHQQISEGNIINNIRQYWDFIGYFQIGDNPGRREPGTGEMNYQNIFQAIHAMGYKGLLGGEHGLSTPGEAGLYKCFEAYRKADSFEVERPMPGAPLSTAAGVATGPLTLEAIRGKDFVLQRLVSDGQAIPLASGTRLPTIQIGEDGKISGFAGVNRYFGNVTTGAAPGELTLKPMGTTRMAGPESSMKLETEFLKALGKTTRGSATASGFILESADKSSVVEFGR